jgi:hypothetical protein
MTLALSSVVVTLARVVVVVSVRAVTRRRAVAVVGRGAMRWRGPLREGYPPQGPLGDVI